MSDFTRGLNPEQAEAVLHTSGPLLILAGAGSGKTTVLVARTGRMIADGSARSSEICVLTFTNKAARELKSRVGKRLGASAKGLWAGTFHSFGLQFLKKHHVQAGLPKQFGVIDQSDSQAIIKELLKDIQVAGKDKFDLERLLSLVQEFRVRGRFQNPEGDEYLTMAEALVPKYEKKLRALGVVDFEDLLLKPVHLLKTYPEIKAKTHESIRYLMVDEFQDTNSVQMQLIDQILGAHRNLAVVGDDDQSIYGWRGAEVSNILQFPKRYSPCRVIRLERNYRSTSKILDLANHVIHQNDHRHGKVLRAESSKGMGESPELFVYSSEDEEAESVVREIKDFKNRLGKKWSDIAVLYRSNSQSAPIEALLRQEGVPFSVSGGTSMFDRKEIKDALAYLRLAVAPSDLAFRRVFNVPQRGIGDHTVERFLEAMTDQGIGFQAAARKWAEIGVSPKIGESIDGFFALVSGFAESLLSDPNKTPGQKFLDKMAEIGFRDYVWTLSKEPQAGEKRWMGIEILSRILDRFVDKGGKTKQSLVDFIETMELRDDGQEVEKTDEVSLMTLHASKGLEFPVVFLVGVEEDLLPHRTLGSDVSEERRLFYVGITRAQEKLMLSRCQTRRRHGASRPVSGSRFLIKIPGEMLKIYSEGVRPVSGQDRDNLMKNFLASLDQKSSKKTSSPG